MKNLFFKCLAICALMAVCATPMSAQSFLKKLSKAADKVTSTDEQVTSTVSEVTGQSSDTAAAVKPLKWDNIPVYHVEKRVLTFEDGTPKKNSDGSPMVRVLLVDQFNNIRSAEAVNEQHKKLNKAITNILLKVGGGAAIGVAGGLLASKGKASGALIGGATGAAAGLVFSAKDIKAAKAQKKSLKQQEELIAKYQENFTSEGTPINASVDVSKIDGLEITEGVSMTAESLKSVMASESFNSSDDSAWTI
jgi:gas vesicle protein